MTFPHFIGNLLVACCYQNKNVKNDKDLAKQQRLEEKEKIKEQKAMMKQAKI